MKPKPERAETSFNLFLDLIPNEPIELNELVKRYNNYFGVNISSRSFALLKPVKDSFTKDRSLISGKRITTYIKK